MPSNAGPANFLALLRMFGLVIFGAAAVLLFYWKVGALNQIGLYRALDQMGLFR